jgi:hypothetical protein
MKTRGNFTMISGNMRSVLLLSAVIFLCCSTTNQTNVRNDKLAAQLTEIGYAHLFQLGARSLADSIWRSEKNHQALPEIVSNTGYDDYARLLASEILFEKEMNYPAKELADTLAYIYSKALFITGHHSGSIYLDGNLWGFMYEGMDDGRFGLRLLKIGEKAVPYLSKLLDDNGLMVYEGSEETLVGERLNYRVKDAAAYYIGRITGIAVPFHENWADRDVEIEGLKRKLEIK